MSRLEELRERILYGQDYDRSEEWLFYPNNDKEPERAKGKEIMLKWASGRESPVWQRSDETAWAEFTRRFSTNPVVAYRVGKDYNNAPF